jgi:hypothetical protein
MESSQSQDPDFQELQGQLVELVDRVDVIYQRKRKRIQDSELSAFDEICKRPRNGQRHALLDPGVARALFAFVDVSKPWVGLSGVCFAFYQRWTTTKPSILLLCEGRNIPSVRLEQATNVLINWRRAGEVAMMLASVSNATHVTLRCRLDSMFRDVTFRRSMEVDIPSHGLARFDIVNKTITHLKIFSLNAKDTIAPVKLRDLPNLVSLEIRGLIHPFQCRFSTSDCIPLVRELRLIGIGESFIEFPCIDVDTRLDVLELDGYCKGELRVAPGGRVVALRLCTDRNDMLGRPVPDTVYPPLLRKGVGPKWNGPLPSNLFVRTYSEERSIVPIVRTAGGYLRGVMPTRVLDIGMREVDGVPG